jgi:arsenite methyltransferase
MDRVAATTIASAEDERSSNAAHLSNHYAIAKDQYDNAIRSVEFEPGSRVLDAGCGGGDFLHPIASRIGTHGRISAIDISKQNVDHLNERLKRNPLPTSVDVRVGSVVDIPFEDDTFHYVWCANVAQYLTEEDFPLCISEFRRVLRQGGQIAIKDIDVMQTTLRPLDAEFVMRLHAARKERGIESGRLGPWCGSSIADRLKQNRVQVTQRRKFVVEHRHPLTMNARHYLYQLLRYYSSIAAHYDVPSEDRNAWEILAAQPEQLLGLPTFCFRETFHLVVGIPIK